MTDFVTDLEQQLVAAARRRRRRRRLARLPAFAVARPLRLVPVLAGVAAIVVAMLGVAALTGDGPVGDDRAAVPPPGSPETAIPLALPYPGTFTTCAELAPGRPRSSGAELRDLLGTLRRPARPLRWKPDLRQDGAMLLPVAFYREAEFRGMRIGDTDLLLAPSAGVVAAHCGAREWPAPEPGACLASRRAAFLAARCWSVSSIERGMALTMAAPRDWIAGIAPDGVGTVEIQPPGAKGAYSAVVRDNVFVVKVPGARRGTRVDVTMRGRGGPRVAFLNGTTQETAARATEKRLRASGYRFRTAAIGNALSQIEGTSRVYRTSRTGTAAQAAAEVAGRLDLNDLYDATPPLRRLAPEADVIVVVGTDGWTSYAPLDEDDGPDYEPPAEHRGGGQ